eukprot:TRINITY_DN7728_c0_g1_i5.p1 TRINITY_DN7728_c0_g1~~TRINITY_DN7728_c0_g1_i5.p1  ORF type:complete len:491 (-),score=73.69 TRINITY_DN7728_c0_g1_i5:394-1866(-)
MASLQVVESCVRLRAQLNSIRSLSGEESKNGVAKTVPIMHDGVNYLVKMKSDTAFLASSELGKWFKFSSKADPFLVTPAAPYMSYRGASKYFSYLHDRLRQLDALKQKSKMMVLPIPTTLLKRIKAAESIIIEESITEGNSEARSSSRRTEFSPTSEPTIKSSSKFTAEKSPANKQPQLKPLNISEDEIPALLEQYSSMVPSKFLESYLALTELLEKSQTGYEPCWLCYTESEHVNYAAIKGLAVFYVDPEAKVKPRVQILHASVTAEEDLDMFLKDVVEYIWSKTNCQEIRVGITHIDQVGEKLVPYEPLKAAYQSLQFRWKTLTNDENGKRILVLGVNRPADKLFLNPRYHALNGRRINELQEPITFRHAAVCLLSENEEVKRCGDEVVPMSQCSYLAAVLGLKMAGLVSDMTSLQFINEQAFPSRTLLEKLENLVLLRDNHSPGTTYRPADFFAATTQAKSQRSSQPKDSRLLPSQAKQPPYSRLTS